MKISTKIALLAVMLSGAVPVYGQDISVFRKGLSEPDTLSSASVLVREHGSAADVIYGYDAVERPASVQGYRICIFFDNSQAARNDSAEVQERFREQFPSIPIYRVYESPSWIVSVGNCVTMEEALVLQNRVKGSFNIAFLRKGEIPLAEFLKEGDGVPEEAAAATETDDTRMDETDLYLPNN